MPVKAILNHLGEGRFECRFDDQRQECVQKFPENATIKAELTQPRSIPHHRHFFKKVSMLWETLPEGEERFPDTERLRKYLLVRAGYREQQFWPLEAVEEFVHMFKQFGLFSGELFFVPKDNGIIAMKAKSIEWAQLDEAAFCEIDKRVNVVIAKEFQINPDELMEQAA